MVKKKHKKRKKKQTAPGRKQPISVMQPGVLVTLNGR